MLWPNKGFTSQATFHALGFVSVKAGFRTWAITFGCVGFPSRRCILINLRFFSFLRTKIFNFVSAVVIDVSVPCERSPHLEGLPPGDWARIENRKRCPYVEAIMLIR